MDEKVPPTVVFGAPAGDQISIRVLGRGHPQATDFGDGNWLTTMIDFTLGQFEGTIAASLRAEEIREFRQQLGNLYSTLRGQAALESMENWLTLRVTMTGAGRLDVTGLLIDRPGTGNELKFNIAGLDQSYLPAVLDSLGEILTAYPVLAEERPVSRFWRRR